MEELANTTLQPTGGGEGERFEFVVDEAGKFALASGFPTHSVNGRRIRLDVNKDYSQAAFVAPEVAPAEAAK